jgi:hypothetical protein
VRSGSRHGRGSTSLCPLLYCGPVGTHHNSTTLYACGAFSA